MQSNFPDWGTVLPAGGERHLPVYLLLDSSGSMEGAPIESLHNGLEQFRRETAQDPFARDAVRVGVIVFNSDVHMVGGGLVPVSAFQTPFLVASGVTRLDLAFRRLLQSIDSDVVKAVKGGQKGDWRPVVFILTDGGPTDERGNGTDDLWRPARDALTNRLKGQIKPSTIVSVGCGPNVDDATLKAMSTGTAFRMGTSVAAFAKLFEYLTQSITSSVQPGGDPTDPFAHVPLDPNLIRIA